MKNNCLLNKHFFVALLFFIAPCEIFAQASFKKMPKVVVHIALNKDIVTSQDSIRVTIEITNNCTKIQQLLLDKPPTGGGGPWYTTGDVIDLKTGKSVVQIQNRAVLSSQIYQEKDLKDKYYQLNKIYCFIQLSGSMMHGKKYILK